MKRIVGDGLYVGSMFCFFYRVEGDSRVRALGTGQADPTNPA